DCTGLHILATPSPFFFFSRYASHPHSLFSLHDALPISAARAACRRRGLRAGRDLPRARVRRLPLGLLERPTTAHAPRPRDHRRRSEEHTSELQSRFDLVCRLLLEKKKNSLPECRAHSFR